MSPHPPHQDPPRPAPPVTPSPPSPPPQSRPSDPSVNDPPSFPTQQWDPDQPLNDDLSDDWDDEDDYLHLHEWEAAHPAPPRDKILEALQAVYHQTGRSLDGAPASLNAVLQGPYFDDDSLMQLTGGGPIDAYALNLALRPFSLTLLPANARRTDTPPRDENAFLVYQFSRWFSLRRVGAHWLNLSERVFRPAQILPWDLSVSLGQLQDDGCEVYVVKGTLPMCPADEGRFFEHHFRWSLNGGVMTDAEEESDCCDYARGGGECMCYDSTDDTYEDELQAAIEASLADAQSHKKLVIKSSPPTSLVSSEEGGGGALAMKGDTSAQVSGPLEADSSKGNVTQV